MTDPIFCCSNIAPHKPIRTLDDPKFSAFRNATMNNDIRFLPPKVPNAAARKALLSDGATNSVSAANGKAIDRSGEVITISTTEIEEEMRDDEDDDLDDCTYVVQVVRRFDLANVEWVRYFTNRRSDAGGRRGGWVEVESSKIGEPMGEGEEVTGRGWVRGESFKNFACKYHYRMFEMNLYEKDF
jgi:hypothetical protein